MNQNGSAVAFIQQIKGAATTKPAGIIILLFIQ
jgi:hypothetical protein